MASTEPNYFQGSITCIEKAYSKQTNIHTKTNKQKKKNKEIKKEQFGRSVIELVEANFIGSLYF